MAKVRQFADKIKITGYDELFGGGAGVKCDAEIREIPLADIRPFANHPFKVKDDEEMEKLAESVKENGVIVPALARPSEGKYELISGHRRKRAAELAGLTSIPVIVRDIDDDAATIAMVDANLQRERILPSEKAFSYKMKLEALKHQGKRNDLTSVHNEQKLMAREQVAEEAGESMAQVQRFIRLTELCSDFLKMLDEKKMALLVGVDLSYLDKDEQTIVLDQLKELQITMSTAQSGRIRELSNDGKCTAESVYAVLSEEKPKERKFVMKSKKISEYFPAETSQEEIEEIIFGLLDKWRESTKDGEMS